MGKPLHWVLGQTGKALKVQISVGEMEVTQKPGERTERALQRKHSTLPEVGVSGKVPQRRES